MAMRAALFAVAMVVCACTAHAMVIGIDVGSEYVKVALVKPGTPFEIVHNSNSRRKSEAIVAFYNDQRNFAGDAKVLLTRKPHLVFRNVLPLLGRNISHPHVRRVLDAKKPAFLVEEAEGGRNTLGLRAGNGKGDSDEEKQLYSAEEIMSMIFTYVRSFTADVAGTCVGGTGPCVLCVPTASLPAACVVCFPLARVCTRCSGPGLCDHCAGVLHPERTRGADRLG